MQSTVWKLLFQNLYFHISRMVIINFLFRGKLDTRNILTTSDYLYLNKDIDSTNLWKCSSQVPKKAQEYTLYAK